MVISLSLNFHQTSIITFLCTESICPMKLHGGKYPGEWAPGGCSDITILSVTLQEIKTTQKALASLCEFGVISMSM